MAAGLAAFLPADPQFPDNDVISIYFDTPDLESIAEKVNGDSRKCKVRLRWYEERIPPARRSAAFLEVKLRHGETRRKLRVEVPASAEPWRGLPLEHPAWIDLPRRFSPPAFGLEPGLVPTAMVRYRRRRFVEPPTGSRIALDSDVRAIAWHRGLLPGVAPVRLNESILEVKTAAELAPVVRFLIARLGGRRQGFSKYTASLGLH